MQDLLSYDGHPSSPHPPPLPHTHPTSPLPPSCRYDNLPPNDAHLQKIADHVSAYLQIVRSQLLATVPKAVVHCMVSSTSVRVS